MVGNIVSKKVDYCSKSKLIKEFLENYPSRSTRTNYSSMLNHFFNFIKIEPDKYFNDNRDYSKDVKNYAISMEKFAPKTKHTRLACLKSILMEYDIELKQKVWRNINRRSNGNRAITQDKIPIPSELKKILQFGTIKSRTLFLTVACSGMRINEAINLTWSDIDFEMDPIRVRIPAFSKDGKKITKNGCSRITFITNEAKEALFDWKKVREEYLEKAIQKTKIAVKKYYKNAQIPIDNDRVFPFTYSTALKCWTSMIYRAGSPFNQRDRQTNRLRYHIHTLRKFFRTQLSLGVGNPDIAEVLMGHEGYLTSSYRHISEEELAKQYKEGLNRLLIYTDMETIKSYTSKLEEQIHSTNTTLATQDMKLRNIEEVYETKLRREKRRLNFLTDEMIKLKTQLRDITFRQDEKEADKSYEERKMEIDEIQNKKWIEKFPTHESQKKEIERLQTLEKVYDEKYNKPI